ncbi:PepSY-associated TM helix domain-containing protein [Oharaeibacter diazotrophicus]|uniref:Putative iron-regulated membrane protein n=2 Tax=Oharaeibacter diazotrophicus TaxID=1920512 RepID=A0A4R6RM69_9HYPH|nr:PepSY domain-containing protein [Oharaeibacter diazotrophicus]TDP87245.1 putative iron-regulated membrane protein [Oharaeibacter diazotrophicus]BBE70812.1 PepSY-associated TM helix [Pleomorphomonas sp. SM30]GLS77561.1 membrane protein [Oharaeibacter diazotrophicus]
MTTTTADLGPPVRERTARFYFAAWRWHFYAGLYVAPFLIMLAVTGLIMLWSSTLYGRNGENTPVAVGTATVSVQAQADAAAAAVPGGSVSTYIAPNAADHVAGFRVDEGENSWIVLVDPYTGAVVDSTRRNGGWYDLADKIHGTLLIGTVGDRLIEIAASFGMVLIATGIYLWWPRQGRGLGAALRPDLAARRRPLWKSLHQTVGIWTAVILALFLVSGLSWAGIWGERFVQAWSTFPAEKWDAVPLSDATHAAMNHGGEKEVPWALEQTPMPASGSTAGAPGADAAPTLEGIVAWARAAGFEVRMQVSLPAGETGVWTVSRDSMSKDSHDPTSDRTVHLDRYTGRVLADVRYDDYSLAGKAMAIGIPLHEGDMGLVNALFNTVFCLSIVFLSVSGVVMWWQRRPKGVARLAAPPVAADVPMPKGAVLVMLAVSFAFPLAGLTLLAVLALDVLVVSRLPALRDALS